MTCIHIIVWKGVSTNVRHMTTEVDLNILVTVAILVFLLSFCFTDSKNQKNLIESKTVQKTSNMSNIVK